MIGQLTGGVAHDFNNLLMVVQANLEALGAALPGQRTDCLHLLDNALSGVTRGAALTERMLAFARRQELAPAAVDVARLIEGMRDLLVRTLGPSVHVKTRIGHSVPPALVDAHQLEMALLNLAVNARDAMEGAGELVFAVALHAVPPGGTLAAGDYVRVRVSDTGSGMDSATLAKATEPFFTTKAVGDGTGLGLSMVHGLTEQSGGSFRLIERREGGITAEIMLPVADGVTGGIDDPAPFPPTETAATTGSSSHSRSARVLLVDDDALVLHGIARMLERFGHDVWKAPSGEAALQILIDEPAFDLLITDHAMPGMSGMELARTVRQRGFARGIVLSSGYAAAAEIADGELISAELRKPFAGKQLLAVVNRVLASV